jgi:hypothetical protein
MIGVRDCGNGDTFHPLPIFETSVNLASAADGLHPLGDDLV